MHELIASAFSFAIIARYERRKRDDRVTLESMQVIARHSVGVEFYAQDPAEVVEAHAQFD